MVEDPTLAKRQQNFRTRRKEQKMKEFRVWTTGAIYDKLKAFYDIIKKEPEKKNE